eukprot:scaffold18134_cov76-Skeletonema_dohrnii-CCMP3373.AAC.1
MKTSSCLSVLSSLMIVSSSICAATIDISSREAVAGPQRRLLDDNIIDKEILSTYSQLATQQCNFTTPLSTLLTAKPGDSCPFSVRIGIARLGVDIMEDITSEEDGSNNSTTVFLEGTRDLI